jgi:hypothetical protein
VFRRVEPGRIDELPRALIEIEIEISRHSRDRERHPSKRPQ